eukprot:9806151-Lingulodinium_polyedra.AAC.1
MRQHLRVAFKGGVAKPIDLFNAHSPSSTKRPLSATTRQQFSTWFQNDAGSRSLIGGDLNSS